MSKETFKEFVKTKPYLAEYVLKNNITWQQLYEIYDMYGESSDVWNKYKPSESRLDFLSKIDTDSLTKHIETAQKAQSHLLLLLQNHGSLWKFQAQPHGNPLPL